VGARGRENGRQRSMKGIWSRKNALFVVAYFNEFRLRQDREHGPA
jgi:hypothetical protein